MRVSAPGRFEYRAVDSMVNPYLMAGAILKAADDGIKNKIDPGKPEERNIYAAMEAGKQVKKLPMTLGRCARGPEEGRSHQVGDAGRDAPAL